MNSEKGYTCALTATTRFNTPESTEVIIEGEHEEDLSDNDVVFIHPSRARSQDLEFIPSSIFSLFTNLIEVDFNIVSLKMITAQTFGKAFKMRKLYLQDNRISSLPGNLFINKHVESVDIRNNVISEIAWNSFAGLIYLDVLHLRRNRLQSLDPRLFKDLVSLREIYLDYNQITDIPDDLFKSCVNLEFVTFGSNLLHTLKSESFLYLTSLKTLHLYDNRIRHIERMLFDALQEILEFQFKDNVCADFNLSEITNVNLEVVPRLERCFDKETRMCLAVCSITSEL